ncbi:hypothetical protein [Arthrobacter sp. Y81]|uniref:hypothetical protein n=1 Tax=Arthrobacter sp. Y81 TaxID=2058897 RepID=UPI002156F8DC|nr:hypothetical protein [Arthrobacter sp. Y81]
MNGVLQARRRRHAAAAVVLAVLMAAPAMQGCSPGTPVPAPRGPLAAGLNQFRDNYGTQIIEIQLSNTSSVRVTVLAADVSSTLFPAGAAWQAGPEGTEVPPGQTKSLPARLPAPSCQSPAEDAGARTVPAEATVSVRQGSKTSTVQMVAADPFGVLARNYEELCLARDAGSVAVFRLAPDLEVAADARTAVVRLTVTPNEAGTGTIRELTIERIDGTTLLAAPPDSPWPSGVRVAAGTGPAEFRLRVRPARCDPHAVAEDKVGTLLPLLVNVGGREGTLKVAAGPALKGQIHDFVTAACGAH